MDAVLNLIVSNPAVLGALVQAGIKWLHGALVGLDKSGQLDKFGPQLHIAFLVLTFLASVANAAANKELANIDLTGLTTFLTYWVQVLVGGKAMAVSSAIPWREKIVGK